jgi:peroxiredoxin
VTVIVIALIGVVAYAVISNRAPGGAPGDGGTDGGGTQTGQPAPLFSLTDIDGNAVSLQSLRGKVVVLDLFATWCGPCRTQMGELKQVYARYNASDVVILSIDVDNSETQSQVRAFRSDYGAPWTFCTDTDSVGAKYGAQYIPTLAIIDRAGDLSHLGSGVEQSEDLIARIDPLLVG